MKHTPEKHVHFFALLDAFDSDACPCCRYVTRARAQFWQSLIYEHTNDRGFRGEFSDGHGFCSRHAYDLLRLNDGLTTAILYAGILSSTNRGFSATSPKRFSVGVGCPVCHREVVWEERFQRILYAFVEDQGVRRRVSEGHVLCVPHLRRMQGLYRRLPPWFLTEHRDRYRECERQLSRYIDSCNHSICDRPVLDPEEQKVSRRVVELLYGSEGRTGR